VNKTSQTTLGNEILAAGGYALDLVDKLKTHELGALEARGVTSEVAADLLDTLIGDSATRATMIDALRTREPASFVDLERVSKHKRGNRDELWKIAADRQDREKRGQRRLAEAMKPKGPRLVRGLTPDQQEAKDKADAAAAADREREVNGSLWSMFPRRVRYSTSSPLHSISPRRSLR
jgi:hypothetical protein